MQSHYLYPLYETLSLTERAVVTFEDFLRLYATEAILRRVSELPDAEEYVLRGSLLTRQWVKPVIRPAADLDFACVGELKAKRVGGMLRRAFGLRGTTDVADFMQASAGKFELDRLWDYVALPGLRAQIACRMEGAETLVQVDFGFGDRFLPPPEPFAYTCVTGEVLNVWAVRPELMAAWKLHGLFEREDWEAYWRPKDLWDLCLLCEYCPLDQNLFVKAARSHFADRKTPLRLVRHLLDDTFLKTYFVQSWQEFSLPWYTLGVPQEPDDALLAVMPLVSLLDTV